MKKLLIAAVIVIPAAVQAQNAITSDLVEGGKTLVELIKLIKTPRVLAAVKVVTTVEYTDSCITKQLADISFKNKTDKPVQISLYLRTGNTYAINPLSLILSALSQESLYELKTGIYKYKIETGEEDDKFTLHEGELKLQPCDKIIREIK